MGSTLLVQVLEPGVEPERVEELAIGLRRELLELDVDAVTPARGGEAPAGTRAVDLVALGALFVSVQTSTGAVLEIVRVVRGWLDRATSANRTVKITIGTKSIELTSATAANQDALVEEFLRSVAAEDAPAEEPDGQ